MSTALGRAPPRMIWRVTGCMDFGAGRDQRARRDVALRHPRPFVEKARGFVERLDIDLDDLRPQPRKTRERGLVGHGRRLVAKEQAVAGRRHPEPDAFGHWAEGAERLRARIGIGMIRSCHHGQRREAVVDRQREHRGAVERTAGGHQAEGRHQSEARLQSDDVVERGGNAARSGGVGAERERHQAGGDRDRRARTRAARDQARLQRHCAGCRRACGCRLRPVAN